MTCVSFVVIVRKEENTVISVTVDCDIPNCEEQATIGYFGSGKIINAVRAMFSEAVKASKSESITLYCFNRDKAVLQEALENSAEAEFITIIDVESAGQQYVRNCEAIIEIANDNWVADVDSHNQPYYGTTYVVYSGDGQ